jgi:hypothetical protein
MHHRAPQSIADMLAREHLQAAITNNSSQRLGWRRCPHGTLFWALTTIDAVVLRDGRVQGFSHVIRKTEGPASHVDAVRTPSFSHARTSQPGGLWVFALQPDSTC